MRPCYKRPLTLDEANARAEALRGADHRSVVAYSCGGRGHWHVGHKKKMKRECRGCRAEKGA